MLESKEYNRLEIHDHIAKSCTAPTYASIFHPLPPPTPLPPPNSRRHSSNASKVAMEKTRTKTGAKAATRLRSFECSRIEGMSSARRTPIPDKDDTDNSRQRLLSTALWKISGMANGESYFLDQPYYVSFALQIHLYIAGLYIVLRRRGIKYHQFHKIAMTKRSLTL